MKQIIDYPPNIKQIKEVFPILPESMLFCYGDVIYNPNGQELADHIQIHELTHSDQQQEKPEEWWNKYLNSISFRLLQESEAYRKQYQFAKKFIKDRNNLFKFLHLLAVNLSSEMYGKICSYEEAIKIIRK